ncbi:cytochrome b/b6 domain-containing protein [Ferrimonas pelagia]|uniref:Cytochrome b/b6 domain-containing protein n=1 Tax=Ferrimonas pelagia TaxID=1177826 RepID=A0ABP9FGX4_9GAMM
MKTQVWDRVVRLSHWSLVVLVVGCWLSAELGAMEWHQTCAYLLLAVLVTRLSWGLFGSETARLRPLFRPPGAVVQYVRQWRSQRQPELGHNPAGGYMVLLMFALLSLQLITGLFASDDILTEGPLYGAISAEAAASLTSLHHLNFTWIKVAIGCHLLAIILYRCKGIRLVPAMLTGYHQGVEGQVLLRQAWPALLLLGGMLAAVLWGLILPLW